MSRRNLISAVLIIVVGSGAASSACGQSAGSVTQSAGHAAAAADSVPPTLVIMPVVNYSEKGEAHKILLPRLLYGLNRLGLTYLTSDDIRPLLREYRIRSRGWIGQADAEILHRETRARFLLLASWDVFKTDFNPEIGLSLRILDLEQMTLVGAVSVGQTGADFTRVLGLGTITYIEELADEVISRALDSLIPGGELPVPSESNAGCFRVALIPFDNFSGTPNAGDILTNIVLSGLLDHGYFVVEPGFVRELGLNLEIINRGGVDRQSALSLLDSFGACRVVTGAVEKFAVARGAATSTVPELALGLRVMSPRDGTLYMMEELGGAGNDGDGMFQLGRTHALVTLTNKVVEEFLGEVVKKTREDILDGDQSQ